MSVPTLHFGDGDDGVAVDLPKLIASRMLIQANSGGGKSWAVRYILEQTHGQVQQLVIDTEGEFASLREQFDYVLAGSGGDLPATIASAKLLCRRLVELGASSVVDIYDLSMPDRRRFVKLFLDELMHLPKKLWRPLLVVIDEAHRYAPETGKSEAAEQVQALCSQGRKRGFCAVLVTQRLSKLSKDAAAELLNKLIGRTHLDVDVQRAGDDLGFDKKQRQRLKSLHPGEFYVYGPAIGREVTLVRTGVPSTTHPEPGKVAPAPPPPPEAVQKLIQQLDGIEEEAAEEERTLEDLRAKSKALNRKLAAAEAEIRKLVAREEGATAEELEAARQAAYDHGRAQGVLELQKIVANEVLGIAEILEKNRKVAADYVESLEGGSEVGGGTSRKAGIESGQGEPATGRPKPRASRRQAVRPAPTDTGDVKISGPQQRILDVLAELEVMGVDTPTRGVVAALCGVSPRSSGFDKNLSTLRAQHDAIDYPQGGKVSLTDVGRAMAAQPAMAHTLEELHEGFKNTALNRPQGRILDVLVGLYPNCITREDLAVDVGVSATSSGFDKNLSSMRTLGIIDYPEHGRVVATDLLFPEGLR